MGAGTGEERTVETKKPYHWVTVKKTYVGEKSEPSGEGEGRTLEYRVWVRGHFRHYQSGLCIWIDPHVRGPSYAPWKHNRYKVLYENTIKPYEEMTKKT